MPADRRRGDVLACPVQQAQSATHPVYQLATPARFSDQQSSPLRAQTHTQSSAQSLCQHDTPAHCSLHLCRPLCPVYAAALTRGPATLASPPLRLQPLDDAERAVFTKQAQAFVDPGFKLVMKEKVGGSAAVRQRG